MSEDVSCPFCNDKGFDLIGLKYHLERYCEKYRDTLSVEEEQLLREVKRQQEKQQQV